MLSRNCWCHFVLTCERPAARISLIPFYYTFLQITFLKLLLLSVLFYFNLEESHNFDQHYNRIHVAFRCRIQHVFLHYTLLKCCWCVFMPLWNASTVFTSIFNPIRWWKHQRWMWWTPSIYTVVSTSKLKKPNTLSRTFFINWEVCEGQFWIPLVDYI